MTISIRTFFTTMILTAALLVPALFVATNSVHAVTASSSLCNGIGYTSGDTALTTNGNCGTAEAGNTAVSSIISTVIDLFSIVVGAVSVIMIIVGGLRYITSAGDSSNVSAAKSTILYAIVGLVIVIFAQTIVKFVIGRITTA